MHRNGPVASRNSLCSGLGLRLVLQTLALLDRMWHVLRYVVSPGRSLPPTCVLCLNCGTVPLSDRRLVRTNLAATALTLDVGPIVLLMRAMLLLWNIWAIR